MFETVRRELGSLDSVFVGTMGSDGAWGLDLDVALRVLRTACGGKRPLILLGTAFSFVHLPDHLVEKDVHFNLPPRLARNGNGWLQRPFPESAKGESAHARYAAARRGASR